MKVNHTPESLIQFEERVCQAFAEKKIRSPIHLYDGNEEQMRYIFQHYVEEDSWVCCSWRSHYQCLLKGVPEETLMQAILEGKSISLCFSEYKVIASAIVGGILPIALGIALGIKRQGGKNKVVCFLGEMTAESGIFHECLKYSTNHELPILWVIECNGKSVCTDTRQVWNTKKLTYEPDTGLGCGVYVGDNYLYYNYTSKFPHAGGLQRVNF